MTQITIMELLLLVFLAIRFVSKSIPVSEPHGIKKLQGFSNPIVAATMGLGLSR